MDTVEKKVSNTKLVVIDTKTMVAHSYVGNQRGGEANLPNPEEDDYTAAELLPQLNEFREAADAAIYRAKVEEERRTVQGKKLMAATEEYNGWFDRLVPEEELDTFGL